MRKKASQKSKRAGVRRARLKAAREERQRADEESALASLSERDIEELTRALNDQYYRENEDKYLDDLLDYVEEKGTDVFVNTGYWHAVPNIHLELDERKLDFTIKAWAKNLDAAFVKEMKYYFETPDSFMLEEKNLYIAVRWHWSAWFFNRMSAGGYVEVAKFEECTEHELGGWDHRDQKLRRHGTVQPSIGALGGKFVCGGNAIARPEFYRDDSCMLNLFLEWVHDKKSKSRLKTDREKLNHAALYKLATGKDLKDGHPGDVTLHEAEAWLKLWRLSGGLSTRLASLCGDMTLRTPIPTLRTERCGAL